MQETVKIRFFVKTVTSFVPYEAQTLTYRQGRTDTCRKNRKKFFVPNSGSPEKVYNVAHATHKVILTNI